MNEMAALSYVQVAEAKTHVKTSYVAGMCQVMEMQGYPFEEKYQNRVIGVEETAAFYVYDHLNYLKLDVDNIPASAVTVERQPKHGTLDVGHSSLMAKRRGERLFWRYTPDLGFVGTDQATFMVDVQGIPVQVVAVTKITDKVLDDPRNEKLCNPWTWMISDANSVPGIPNFSFSSFSGASLAQITGIGASAQITFDTDAAGHGLVHRLHPVSQRRVPADRQPLRVDRQARFRSEGKMVDLLSVQLEQTVKRRSPTVQTSDAKRLYFFVARAAR
jgi:hypothetical protein